MNTGPTDCPFQKLHPSQLVRDDEFFMKMAYNQAIDAWTQDEVPIGAVIVHNEQIVAAAYNQTHSQKDPTAHAEIIAITQASRHLGDWRLNEMTLYVTKEPCPMCSGAAIMARLNKVVYAFSDPSMGCLGGAYPVHELPKLNHQLQIASGVLENECKTLVQAFFARKREVNSSTLDESV